MRTRCVITSVAVAGGLAVMSAHLVGQSAPPRPTGSRSLPRTADGRPDLQGVYDVATLTPLERAAAFGTSLTMTEEQAKRLETMVADRIERAARPSDGNRA